MGGAMFSPPMLEITLEHLHPQGLSLRQGQARAATIHVNSISLCICGSTHEGKRDVSQLGLQPGQDLPLGLLGHVGPTTKPGYGPCAGAVSGCLWQPFPPSLGCAGDALSPRQSQSVKIKEVADCLQECLNRGFGKLERPRYLKHTSSPGG
ncbi:unnamed protein product [Prunus armeniaca]